MVDIKDYLKYRSHQESREVPYGYIESPIYIPYGIYQSGIDGILIPIDN